jgi:hypothetical protein
VPATQRVRRIAVDRVQSTLAVAELEATDGLAQRTGAVSKVEVGHRLAIIAASWGD